MGGVSGQRLPYAQAFEIAQEVYELLRPVCTRIQIAGSLRRQCENIGDIEIVAIPRQSPRGLFGDELEVDPEFCTVVNQWPKVKGEPTGKYAQRILPCGMKLDVFIAQIDNWGWQLCLRTGSTNFNRDMLRALKQQGYESDGGFIRQQAQVIHTPEEVDVFRLAKLPWVEPWAREM